MREPARLGYMKTRQGETVDFNQAGGRLPFQQPILRSNLLPRFSIKSLLVLTTGCALAAASLRLNGGVSPVGLALSTATMAFILITTLAIAVFIGGWLVDRVFGMDREPEKFRPIDFIDD